MSRRTGSLEAEVARYLTFCEDRKGCLVHASRSDQQYQTIRFNGGEQMSAHRASFAAHYGPIPPGMVVRHSCDNPPCVNPQHLLVGTQLDNERDKWERGRGAFGLRIAVATVPPEEIRAAVDAYLRGGVSQAEMARRHGISQSAFGRWVRAEARRDTALEGVVVGKGSRIATGIQPCGTRAGYIRHHRQQEPYCEPCRQANITYFRAYRAKRSAA